MKFYAVKVGRTTGVFDNWADCDKSITGFSGAVYKSFPTREEAEAYLADVDLWGDIIKSDIDSGYVVAFSDGSYDDKLKRYSYGVLLIDGNLKESEICGYSSNEKYLPGRNIAGEILGVINALDWAVSNGFSKIKIYHDYEGLGKWATGEWKADSDVARMFIAILQGKYSEIVVILFEKVKGHSSNRYNDRADELAKSALVDRTRLAIQGDNWFTLPQFNHGELQAILDLMVEEHPEIQIEKSEDSSRYIYRILLKKDRLTITLFKSGNKKLLIQGANKILLQMCIAYITELVGIEKIEQVLGSAYRISIDAKQVSDDFDTLCAALPVGYPENIKRLIKQAIINLKHFVKSEDYSQYAFPALRALEGHMKYLFDKCGIAITTKSGFSVFNKDTTTNKYYITAMVADANIKSRLEKYYNFYCDNRNTIFHFGDILGITDSTRMIESKEEADEIIKKCIKFITE